MRHWCLLWRHSNKRGPVQYFTGYQVSTSNTDCILRVLCASFQNNAKVAVLGASGGIGQPLALLLKNSPLVSRLTLYDIAHTPGVAADLSHIETRATVKGTGHTDPGVFASLLTSGPESK